MIILFQKKESVKKDIPERILLYVRCLEYIMAEMKSDDFHTTANIIDVAIYSLSESQNDLPMSIEDEKKYKSKRKLKSKAGD